MKGSYLDKRYGGSPFGTDKFGDVADFVFDDSAAG